MAVEIPKETGIWRQTKALLFKNYLVKCRTKKSSVQVNKMLICWLLGPCPFHGLNWKNWQN